MSPALLILRTKIVVLLTLAISACNLLDSATPFQTVALRDLLVSQEMVPSTWQRDEPFSPAAGRMCIAECIAGQYTTGRDGAELPVFTHLIFRYESSGTASSIFFNEYLPNTDHLNLPLKNAISSPASDLAFYGCGMLAGSLGPTCEWAGLYDEYIVVLRGLIIPGEFELADLEQMIEQIDKGMALALAEETE